MVLKLIFLALATLIAVSNTAAQGYVWTYQGKLTDGGSPANGQYDIRITQLETIDAPAGTDTIFEDVQVTNGIFTVNLTTGALILIENRLRFIEIAVRPGASTGAFTVLSPRQAVNTVPYSGRAASAAEANYSVVAGTITGILPLEKGGTGASDASTARSNLGLGPLSTASPTGTATSLTFLRGDNSWTQAPLVFLATVFRDNTVFSTTQYYYPNGASRGVQVMEEGFLRIPRACTLGSFKVTATRTTYSARTMTVVLVRGGVQSDTSISIAMSGLVGTSSSTVSILADDRISIRDQDTGSSGPVTFHFSMVCE